MLPLSGLPELGVTTRDSGESPCWSTASLGEQPRKNIVAKNTKTHPKKTSTIVIYYDFIEDCILSKQPRTENTRDKHHVAACRNINTRVFFPLPTPGSLAAQHVGKDA